MPDFLLSPFAEGLNVSPWAILARLIVALIFGIMVAAIYSRTSRTAESGMSLPTTLVLLSVLIGMVTQVIGDSVARAFSLVGALSIVRFRTVVRDTRDTAFVIFSVAVGMAAGSQNIWVGLLGIAVGGSAAFLMSLRSSPLGVANNGDTGDPDYCLRVRAALGAGINQALAGPLASVSHWHRLIALGTAKQGTAMEASYELRLLAGRTPDDVVREVNRLDGIQEVRVTRYGLQEEKN